MRKASTTAPRSQNPRKANLPKRNSASPCRPQKVEVGEAED
jgi:hypothetical protein